VRCRRKNENKEKREKGGRSEGGEGRTWAMRARGRGRERWIKETEGGKEGVGKGVDEE